MNIKKLSAELTEEVLSVEGSVMAAACNTFYPTPVPPDAAAVHMELWNAYVDLRDAAMSLDRLHAVFVAARDRWRPFSERRK